MVACEKEDTIPKSRMLKFKFSIDCRNPRPQLVVAYSLILIYLLAVSSLIHAQPTNVDDGSTATLQNTDSISFIRAGDRIGISIHFKADDDAGSYRVRAGDELYLDFHYSYEPTQGQIYFEERKNKLAFQSQVWLSRKYVVQPDQSLALHAINNPVMVGNKTLTEVSALVSNAYLDAGLLSHPEVNISILNGSDRQDNLEVIFPQDSLPVPRDGHLQLPIAGRVRVSGLSVEQLSGLLTLKFRERGYTDVIVTTWHADIAPRYVGVVGAVNMPGLVRLEAGMRIWDVLSAAGGFVTGALIQDVRLKRPGDGESAKSYSFTAYMETGDTSLNPVIHEKDLIYVIHGGNP